MHVFAIALLFGLGVMALASIVDRYLTRVHELWAIVGVVLGVVLAWIAEFDLWALWDVPVRARWIGLTITGLALGGLAVLWREIVGVLGGLFRKLEDEAAALEQSGDLRRIA